MKFTIYAAKIEDISQGWVWLGVEDKLAQRSIIRLSTSIDGNRKSVYSEALKIDDNFLRDYNQQGGGRIAIGNPRAALVISEWYRSRLGLQTRTDVEIDWKAADNFWGQVRACLDHPQIVVRLPTWLGVLGTILGIVGIILGAVPLFKK